MYSQQFNGMRLKPLKLLGWVGLYSGGRYILSSLRPSVAFQLSRLRAAHLQKEFGPHIPRSATGLISVTLFLFLCGLASATMVSIPEVGVSFDVPDGFTSFAKEEIAATFTGGSPPTFIMGNEKRTTMIGYTLHPKHIPTDKLPEAKDAIEKRLNETSSGIEWKKNEIVRMQGRPWIHFEYIATRTYNIQLITSLGGKTVLINWNSYIEEFPAMEPALRKSIQTIRFRPL